MFNWAITTEEMEFYLYILILVLILVSFISQFIVSGAFRKYSTVIIGSGRSGAEIAKRMLADHNIYDINITETRRHLGDHFNPRTKTIALSPDVGQSASISAVAVACHEAGHAVQYDRGMALVKLRTAILPLSMVSSYLAWIVIFIGILLAFASQNFILLYIGAGLLGVILLFSLITLPIEFNASRRALNFLRDSNIVETKEEFNGAKKVLRAAAFTYVLAMLISLAQFARVVLIIVNSKKRN